MWFKEEKNIFNKGVWLGVNYLEALHIKKFVVGGGLVVLSDFSGKLET